MLKLNRLISACALLLGVALLVPKTAKATTESPIQIKFGLQYYIAGSMDFYCRTTEVCCYGFPDCQTGPNTCCGVS